MTISHAASTGVSTATAARGTTSTTVAYVGVSAGRMAVITACVKPSGATFPATLTDGAGKVWDKVSDATGGTGTNGADTGQSRIGKYVRTLDGTETGSITVTPGGTASQVCAVMDTYISGTGAWDTPISVTASDASHGTNPSAASGTWASALAVGDWVHAGYATDTDNTGAASAHNIVQTGTTFSARSARSRLGNSSGNDGSVFTWDAEVTAGGDTSATTLGFTWAASSCGALGALRLREGAALLPGQTILDNFNDNQGTAPTGWDNWGSPNVSETGGQLVLTTSTTAFAYFGAQRTDTYTVTGKSWGTTVVNSGNQSLLGYGAYPISLVFSASNEAYWIIVGGTAFAYTNVGGSYTQRGSGVTDVDGRRYIVGEDGGDILWRWSDDGVTWNTTATLANPWPGDTTVNAYVMVGTDQANGSTTSLVLDDFSEWVITGTTPVSSDLTALWNVRDEVEQSLDARWHVRAIVGQDLDARWHVRETVSAQLDARWVARNRTSAALDARWNVAAIVAIQLDGRWHVRSSVAGSALQALWNVYASTASSLDLRWNVRAIAEALLDGRWHVRSGVSASALDARWHVRSAVAGSALEARWHRRALVGGGLDARWNVRAAVSAAVEGEWRVLAAVGAPLEGQWVVRQLVQSAFEALWDVTGAEGTTTVSSQLTALWRVRTLVASPLDSHWHVRSVAAGALDARWHVRAQTAQTLAGAWNVRGSVAAALEGRWAVLVGVSAELGGLWVVRHLVSGSLDARWNVTQVNPPTPLPADVVVVLGGPVVSTLGGDVVSYGELVVISHASDS